MISVNESRRAYKNIRYIYMREHEYICNKLSNNINITRINAIH